jgi:hypothetical protein
MRPFFKAAALKVARDELYYFRCCKPAIFAGFRGSISEVFLYGVASSRCQSRSAAGESKAQHSAEREGISGGSILSRENSATDQRAGCASNADLPFLLRLRGDFGREIFSGNFS